MTIAMQFGPHLLEDGRVRFRLWAPSARRGVDLLLPADQGPERRLAMQAHSDGWYEITATGLDPGDARYLFQIDGALRVPDPCSRFQPEDVHGPSLLVPAQDFNDSWRGRPWEETIIYELHVGCFTAEGTFSAAAEKLVYLAELGITAVELMPVADFPGNRNWGYDGALPFAPDSSYGTPDELRALIHTAHRLRLMVFLDVVYNHFGPEGNYLSGYARPFFTSRQQTPWGDAVNFDGPDSAMVRRFFIENALYWLTDFGFDGLRLDAVHAIFDASYPHILFELAEAVQSGPGRSRHIHLMLENDANQASYLRWPGSGARRWYAAQWNDDLHHGLHTMLTGETDGYYGEFGDHPAVHLGRALTEGFAWQGEPSPYRGAPRGEPSGDLPPTAFISFLQNHDQIGNRAFGERLDRLTEAKALQAATIALLLAPAIPLLFMGQEWAASSPFLYFCDFEPDLAARVTAGRRQEFVRFAQPEAREQIPDPASNETFRRSKLDWTEADLPLHRGWLDFHRQLLNLRRKEIIPRLSGADHSPATCRILNPHALRVDWRLARGTSLTLLLNLGKVEVEDVQQPEGRPLFLTNGLAGALQQGRLPPGSAGWYVGSGDD